MNGKIFAIGQIVLAIFASVGYALDGDWKHAIYWAAAGVLTATVTF